MIQVTQQLQQLQQQHKPKKMQVKFVFLGC